MLRISDSTPSSSPSVANEATGKYDNRAFDGPAKNSSWRMSVTPTGSMDGESAISEVEDEQAGAQTFNSTIGIVFSCLGSVVGTGNLWRFPRITARNSNEEGALAFLLVWVVSLFFWSMPIIITEYTLGRYTRCAPLAAFHKFLGGKMLWLGAWITLVTFMISSYYSVVVGWCFYYVYYMSALPTLPTDEKESLQIFEHFVNNTYWPVFTHFLALLLVGLCTFGGLKWVERVNSVLVSLLLTIVVITFGWSIHLKYADIGIRFLFTPSWSSLGNAGLWVDAFVQNAFDTGAGMGLYTAYSSYFTRKDVAVRYGTFLPMFNNLISLVCGIFMYSTVFATLTSTRPYATIPAISKIMRDSGPGSTGLTFTWIPVLYATMGTFGRVLCSLFFICLSFAGVTTLISNMQLTYLTIKDFGVPQKIATIIAIVATFLVGLPSAFRIDVLTNQDFVWGFALILTGGSFCVLVIVYGVPRYRKVIVNDFSANDMRLSILWVPIIMVIVPLVGAVMIVWWAYELLAADTRFELGPESFFVTIIEWGISFLVLGLLTGLVIWKKWTLFSIGEDFGYDPHHPDEKPKGIIISDNMEIVIVDDEDDYVKADRL